MNLGQKNCINFGSLNMILNGCLFILSVQFGMALCSWQHGQQRSGIQLTILDGITLAQLLGEPDIAHVSRSPLGSRSQYSTFSFVFLLYCFPQQSLVRNTGQMGPPINSFSEFLTESIQKRNLTLVLYRVQSTYLDLDICYKMKVI